MPAEPIRQSKSGCGEISPKSQSGLYGGLVAAKRIFREMTGFDQAPAGRGLPIAAGMSTLPTFA
jgi:hypothetical protein